MALEAARRLGIYPMRAIVKIGDTLADLDEGLNAGMWTIGVAATGNELGLTEPELAALPLDERADRLAAIRSKMLGHGAHVVVDGIGDAVSVLDAIEGRLARGERP
jgi:phosphonoacetaldehyde hydrolase